MLRAIPTSDFIKQIEELSDLCRHGDDPIILTRQGHGDLVVMGIEAYNKMLTKLQLLRDVAQANAELIENANPTAEALIDQAIEIAHDQIQSRLRLGNAA
ncbi:type II toxin-antitoxin system Phd/YefM family antitoxin [candidate division KSB1 bacterium]|nr:type II toxin-antitoxin system Phd/YefM family antitoxin [candidate division KSB1 bacterium]